MFYSPKTAGFYNLAIHGDTIPADKIEIDADLYQSLMGSLAQGARIEIGPDGLPIAVYPAPPTAEEELAAAKAAGSSEMLAWITGFLSQFTAGVPDDEVKSWPRKAEAARAHLAGQPAPMILPATTNSEVAALSGNELPLNIPMPPGYKILAVLGTAVAGGYAVTAIGGDY